MPHTTKGECGRGKAERVEYVTPATKKERYDARYSPFPLPPSPFRLAEADLSGRQLGDFHLLRRLGRGAMADVYLAEQGRLKRRVAVKILKPELAGDRTYLQRFQLEAQAAASLVHANIVQIYEVGCVDQLHYIAQEYVQGQNLREYIARHGPPDLPHALSIMRQVAAALAKAAEQGVVHRDIKPENIMLTAGGEVKVADFGLARLTREGAANDLTQVGITLGTPLYMSPEQVEGKPLDPRSDIYSFGVTCYHMLSGVPPFRGETALGVAVQHLKKQPAAAGIAARATCRPRCAGSSIRCWPKTRRGGSPRPASCCASCAACRSSISATIGRKTCPAGIRWPAKRRPTCAWPPRSNSTG